MPAFFLGMETLRNTAIVSRETCSAVEAMWDRIHVHTPSHLGFTSSVGDQLWIDNHSAEFRVIGRDASVWKRRAKYGYQSPGDGITEGCADSSGALVWHPVTYIEWLAMQ
jgi:hypothetical protein